MTDVLDAQYTEQTALAVAEAAAPPATLFGTDDPVEILAKAGRVADALVAVVTKKKLVANIKGKQYPLVEAWQTMAAMMSITAVCEWSRPVEGGWEARVVLYNRQREIIGSAEAQCLKDESGKRSWEDYAIRSMAQTRATGKAYRSNLAFIMVLAGYEATPAEEMPHDSAPAAKPQPQRTREEALRIERNERTKQMLAMAIELHVKGPFDIPVTDVATFLSWAAALVPGCENAAKGWKPTNEQIDACFAALEKHDPEESIL